jgi:hypothetical protein
MIEAHANALLVWISQANSIASCQLRLDRSVRSDRFISGQDGELNCNDPAG